jgi:probable F420-dependent oxidoreductase
VTSPLRIGIQLPEVERDVRWPEYLSMARAAEGVGFDSIWVGDHFLYRGPDGFERGPWDAWSLLPALAAVTERVAIGPLVACLAFRPPGVLAKTAATVDEISRGRLVLGVGAGWNETEFRAFGLPFEHRVARFEEAFEIVRRLLAGERVTTSGRYWSAEEAILLPKPNRRPPLMIGSNGPRMLEATLPYVDAWNTWYVRYGNTPEGFASLNKSVTSIAEDVGRPPDEIQRSACVLVVLDPTSGERYLDDDVPPLEGNMERIVAGLRDLQEAGADEVILVVSPINEASIRALEEALVLLDGE